MEVTAYNESEEDCEKPIGHPYYGITASGTYVTEHRTVAAGPELEFGTEIYIPKRKALPNRGFYRVEDRGGAIRKDCIDIYIASAEQGRLWGRQRIEVYVPRNK